MTKLQAIAKKWREIAEAYYTPRGERNLSQLEMTLWGICGALDDLWVDGTLSFDDMVSAEDSISADLGRKTWFCKLSPANDILRADYCELQACIAEEGGV